MIIEVDNRKIEFHDEYVSFCTFLKKRLIEIKYSDIYKVEFSININRLKNEEQSFTLVLYTNNKKYDLCIPYALNGEVESFLRKKNIKITKKFINNKIVDSYSD